MLRAAPVQAFDGLRNLLLSGASARAFVALLGGGLAYRLTLLYLLYTESVTPFDFVADYHLFFGSLRAFGDDCVLALALALLAHGIVRALARASPWLAGSLGLFAVALVVAAVGGVNGVHLRTLFSMHSGLDYELLSESLDASSLSAILDYGEPLDLVIAAVPAVLFAALHRGALERSLRLRTTVAVVALLSLASYLPEAISRGTGHRPSEPKPALLQPPTFYLALSYVEPLLAGPDPHKQRATALPPLRTLGLNPITALPAPRPAPSSASPEWNVLFVIMESAGRGYVFDTHRGNALPMPTLQRLSQGGLVLGDHYASNNTSTHAVFSLLTGLNPRPTQSNFSTRPDLVLPGLGRRLPAHYDRFFVTPGKLQSYFPLALIRHDGFGEIYGHDNLPLPRLRPHLRGARNELDATDVFLARMARAKEPFVGIYYSYAPHYDYHDHGPEYRIFQDLGPWRNRYYNGLRLLDTQIARMLAQLEQSGRLERTLVVAVGDHGEAFGQHPGNWTHRTMSYRENYSVPAVLWQPRLLSPRTVTVPTSHPDVLPTLLDALGVPFDPATLQGWSLLRGDPPRERVYLWGYDRALVSVAKSGIKLEVSFQDRRCRYFDLKRDPEERAPRPCDAAVQPQLDDLLQYWKFQRTALDRHNERLRRAAR